MSLDWIRRNYLVPARLGARVAYDEISLISTLYVTNDGCDSWIMLTKKCYGISERGSHLIKLRAKYSREIGGAIFVSTFAESLYELTHHLVVTSHLSLNRYNCRNHCGWSARKEIRTISESCQIVFGGQPQDFNFPANPPLDHSLQHIGGDGTAGRHADKRLLRLDGDNPFKGAVSIGSFMARPALRTDRHHYGSGNSDERTQATNPCALVSSSQRKPPVRPRPGMTKDSCRGANRAYLHA